MYQWNSLDHRRCTGVIKGTKRTTTNQKINTVQSVDIVFYVMKNVVV